MSLLEDVKEHYKDSHYPPDGPDLDYIWNDEQEKWVKGDTVTKQISYEIIDDSPRWGDVIQAVYQRGDEIVAIEDVAPATESQDWGDYGDPTIYEAKPVEVTVTKYEKV
jgi:hypothetical protein